MDEEDARVCRCGKAKEGKYVTLRGNGKFTRRNEMLEEMRLIDECDMEELSTLDISETTNVY